MSTPGPEPGAWSDTAPVLATGATHLWLCDVDAQRDSALLADYLALLDADEIMTPAGPRRNIRARASDFEQGDVLAPAGHTMSWRAMTTRWTWLVPS